MLKKYKTEEVVYEGKRGNYLIEIKDKKIIVKLVHPENSKELEVFEGANAEELRRKIASKKGSMNTYHAMYLGAELKKAETALKMDLNYEQDVELKPDKKNKKNLFSFLKRIKVVD